MRALNLSQLYWPRMTHKIRDDTGGWKEVPPTNVTEPEIIEVNMDESIFNTCVAACTRGYSCARLTSARVAEGMMTTPVAGVIRRDLRCDRSHGATGEPTARNGCSDAK